MKKIVHYLILFLLLVQCFTLMAMADEKKAAYKSPAEIGKIAKKIVSKHKDVAKIDILTKTPGGRDLQLIELGYKNSSSPAIFVAANMEGNYPLASEAAIKLVEHLVTDWKEDLKNLRWYIIPVGNPDGYSKFFKKPLYEDFRNDRPFNDDKDDAVDEDGAEDLNGDGYITMMRQIHPEGKWIEVKDRPLLMKKADYKKGEKGKYRLFVEGIDNDGDGKINEDGPGGVIPGHNFPHNFKHYTTTDGLWAASEKETRAILRFAFDHPEIAMVLTFGRSNSLKEVPPSSKKSESGQDKYKVPKQFATMFGLDPEKEYPIKELVEMAKEATGMDITEDMLLQFFGIGAAVNPDQKDLPYWNEISKRYNDFIKEVGLDKDRLKPAKFSPGSIEEWAYYQYGVPSFSMDFWTLPVKKKKEEKKSDLPTADEIGKMSNEEFIALGEEKIDKFLKASGAPSQFKASMVINALKSGMLDTKKISEMMKKAEKKKESGGVDEVDEALYEFNKNCFLEWKPYDHPTLGRVEIGGKIPYSTLAPPPDSADTLIEKQLPFITKLIKLLPEIVIEKVEVKEKSRGIYQITAWFENRGFLPYPTHQGNRCRRPTPAVATIKGNDIKLLQGKKRTVLPLLEGSGGYKKLCWLIKATPGATVTLEISGFSIGKKTKQLTLKGGESR